MRSVSRFVAKPARGFQVLRIDGYSCTKELPGGERVTSEVFAVGGRHWCVDYYPNGADASSDESDAIALYLRLVGTARTPSYSYGGVYNYHQMKVRVRAQYKFSMLDLATGDATYELPEKTDIFTISSVFQPAYVAGGSGLVVAGGIDDVGCGYAAFVTRQELEGLIREDRLAIRCDVGVTEVAPPLPVVTPGNTYSSYLTGFNDYNQQPPPADDKEYIRRCLADDDQINQETVVYHPASYTSGNNCNKY